MRILHPAVTSIMPCTSDTGEISSGRYGMPCAQEQNRNTRGRHAHGWPDVHECLEAARGRFSSVPLHRSHVAPPLNPMPEGPNHGPKLPTTA